MKECGKIILILTPSCRAATYCSRHLPARRWPHVWWCVTVKYGDGKEIPMIITPGNENALVDWNWLRKFDWTNLKGIWSAVNNKSVLSNHLELFRAEIGLIKGVKVSLAVDKPVTVWLYKPRSLPRASSRKMKQSWRDLRRLDQWCSELFKMGYTNSTVVRSDHTVRVCGDYMSTVRKALVADYILF